jgi:hypothetical protein
MIEKPKGVKSVRCPHCKEYEMWTNRKEMVIEKGIKCNIYIHAKCYPIYKEEEKVKEKENSQKNKLSEYIKVLHNVKRIPDNFWYLIEDLRNGTERFKENTSIEKKKKKGYGYDVILKSYEMVTKKCLHALATKKFQSEKSKLVYCLRIVEDNLLDAQRKIIQENRKQKIIELEEEKFSEINRVRKVDYKKKENKHDILDLFE